MNLEGKRYGILLRGVELIRGRSVQWFHTFLNGSHRTSIPTSSKALINGSRKCRCSAHDAGADRRHPLVSERKAVVPDGVPVELFNSTLNGDPCLRRRLFDIFDCILRGGEVLQQQWNEAVIMVHHKKKDRIEWGNYRGIPLVAHTGNALLDIIARRLDNSCERLGTLPEKHF